MRWNNKKKWIGTAMVRNGSEDVWLRSVRVCSNEWNLPLDKNLLGYVPDLSPRVLHVSMLRHVSAFSSFDLYF